MTDQQPTFPSSANIYEVNIRQYTPEGSFRAFESHLSRLRDMGVEILWLMPVYPIGKENRKGTLGSYYSISDFKAVNPEFGSRDEFIHLIDEAHSLGMRVLIDWVANHTAFDHIWTITHPEYFLKNTDGSFYSPYDWSDVIQIDHSSSAQQLAMIDAMRYWIDEFNIDGFRADLAHLTPLSFWLEARHQLDLSKPGLIWLAETEDPSYHKAFDISFTWQWMHASEKVCKGEAPVSLLKEVLDHYIINFDPQAYRLFFSSNHDENSWNGTEFEKYGIYASLLAVFSYTYCSIPLVYSGQEIPNKKRLAFFEKDSLAWPQAPELHSFYKILNDLRRVHPAIKCNNRPSDVDVFLIRNSVLAYFRGDAEDIIFTALNFGVHEIDDIFYHEQLHGNFKNLFTGELINVNGDCKINLAPGEYCILVKI